MPVTKQTYTASPAWTASQAADLLQGAFVGAGLMTAWYDSFASGSVENRILEIVYQGSKTFGKCYYWFMVTTTELRIAVASGWNNVTKLPTGTQYVDYFATTTNTNANHAVVADSLATGTQLDIVRYTSNVNGSYSWFVLRNGATPVPFFIAPAESTVVNWLDLDKFLFHHFVKPNYTFNATSGNAMAAIRFSDFYRVRRSYRDAGWMQGQTSSGYFTSTQYPLHGYRAVSSTFNGTSAQVTDANIAVPYGFSGVNPAFLTNYTPVISGYSYSPYVQQSMPVDFGLQLSFVSTAFSFGDRVVVTAGVEEWEVIDFRNNNTTTSGSPLLLAKVV